jgi:tetratricopeptide (TPR) repeat protein
VKYRLTSIGAKRYIFYAASMISAFLAMNTKQIAFTLPFAILLYEFSFFKGAPRKRVLFLIPLLLTLLIIPLSLIDVDRSLGELVGDMGKATAIQNIPRLNYLLTELRVMVTYLRLLVLPVNQNLDYDYPMYDSFFALPVLLSFLFLFSIFSCGIILFKQSRITAPSSRLIAFGIFWFFLSLSVESSIIPLHLIYEHRLYLPSAGFFVVIVTAMFLLLEIAKNQKLTKIVFVVFVLILIVLISATYARNEAWQSIAGLWEDVVSKSPENSRAHNNLGNAYVLEGKSEEAIEHYLLALEARPAIRPTPRYYAEIHYNIANAYKDTGLLDKAIEHYRKALRIDFNNLDAYNNLGLVYSSQDLPQKAITYFQAAIELDPDYAEAHFNLGEVYFSRGWSDKAIEHYKIFLKLRPDHKRVHYNIALAYNEMGLSQKAEEHLWRAEELNDEN